MARPIPDGFFEIAPAGEIKSIPGEKTALVVTAIQSQIGSFAVADLQNACPGVSVDMIRHVLNQLRSEKKVRCLGRGRTSRWEKLEIR